MSSTDICTLCSSYGCNTYEIQIDALRNHGDGRASIDIYIVRDEATNAITGFDGTILVNEEPIKTFEVADVSRLGKIYTIDFTAYAGDSIGVFLRTTAWDGCRLRVTQELPAIFSADNVKITSITTNPPDSFTPGTLIQVTPTVENTNERTAVVDIEITAGGLVTTDRWDVGTIEKQPISVQTPENISGTMDVCADITNVEPGFG